MIDFGVQCPRMATCPERAVLLLMFETIVRRVEFLYLACAMSYPPKSGLICPELAPYDLLPGPSLSTATWLRPLLPEHVETVCVFLHTPCLCHLGVTFPPLLCFRL